MGRPEDGRWLGRAHRGAPFAGRDEPDEGVDAGLMWFSGPEAAGQGATSGTLEELGVEMAKSNVIGLECASTGRGAQVAPEKSSLRSLAGGRPGVEALGLRKGV